MTELSSEELLALVSQLDPAALQQVQAAAEQELVAAREREYSRRRERRARLAEAPSSLSALLGRDSDTVRTTVKGLLKAPEGQRRVAELSTVTLGALAAVLSFLIDLCEEIADDES